VRLRSLARLKDKNCGSVGYLEGIMEASRKASRQSQRRTTLLAAALVRATQMRRVRWRSG